MHANHFLDLEKTGRTCRVFRTHSEIVADAENGKFERGTVADELHVPGQRGVARVIEMSLRRLDEEAARISAIAAVRHTARMRGRGHFDAAEWKLLRSAQIHGMRFFHALLGEPVDNFPVGHERRAGALGDGSHVGHVIEMPVGNEDVVGRDFADINGGRLGVGGDKRVEEQVNPFHLDAETRVPVVGQFHGRSLPE